jgi:cytoskeletal protein CcmA (bactofilin family)
MPRDLHQIDTLIGSTARLQGDMAFAGGLHVDGHIAGNVSAQPSSDSTLSVSEHGRIDGAVEVPNVILDGTVRGHIRARGRVVLGPKSRVEGDVYYGIIEMTLGAEIMGRLQPLPAGEVEGTRKLAKLEAKSG